ncbi:hypothetical protein IBE76_10245, partial [Francisella tularensis]|nr:hypothetical protein [Francisella tularensis]
MVTKCCYNSLKAHLNDAKDTIMDVSYPVATQALEAPEAEKAIVWLQNVVTT